VFGDGHDEVKAMLLCRPLNAEKWSEVPMTFLGNDHWETSFTPETTGKYEYTVLGWVDHFTTGRRACKRNSTPART
jgi:starch synthase (maltosyl-transferring)